MEDEHLSINMLNIPNKYIYIYYIDPENRQCVGCFLGVILLPRVLSPQKKWRCWTNNRMNSPCAEMC